MVVRVGLISIVVESIELVELVGNVVTRDTRLTDADKETEIAFSKTLCNVLFEFR